MMKYLFICLTTCMLCLSCEMGDVVSLQSGGAVSGSITKFKVVQNFLYVIDGKDLRLFSLADPLHPEEKGTVSIGFGPETLFNLGDILFVGAQTGMYMFSLSDPSSPKLLSHYEHILSCDPVVANTEMAYVTLRSGSQCRGNGIGSANELHTIDISDNNNPQLIHTQFMQHPKGLGLDGSTLFVCDGDRGVVVFTIDEHGLPNQLPVGIPDLEALDVIARDNLLIVITSTQILQYDYSDLQAITLLSVIEHGA